jgi:hypothetical protein
LHAAKYIVMRTRWAVDVSEAYTPAQPPQLRSAVSRLLKRILNPQFASREFGARRERGAVAVWKIMVTDGRKCGRVAVAIRNKNPPFALLKRAAESADVVSA